MNLAKGRVTESPFPKEAIDSLRSRVIHHLEDSGFPVERHVEDRTDTLVDFRLMSQMLEGGKGPRSRSGRFFARGQGRTGCQASSTARIVSASKEVEIGGTRKYWKLF